MTEPATLTPAPASKRKKLVERLAAVVAWATSRTGRTEIAAAVGAIGAIVAAVDRLVR